MPRIIAPNDPALPSRYILVTAGGGGDGASVMRAAIKGRARDRDGCLPLVLVLGPFMSGEDRASIRQLAAGDAGIHILDFVNQPEGLMNSAAGIVGMAGYNTFCEIISFNKPAMLVPRILPRREQLIRARRAAELGLVDMLTPDEADDADVMCAHLKALPARPLPNEAGASQMLNGLDRVCDEVMKFPTARDQLGIFVAPTAE